MLRKPPHILVTTPESLYILLTSRGGREMLRTVKTVIVDEIHALARDKRGSHLSLSLERLEALAGPFQRIGLSATQKPLSEVAKFLVGVGRECDLVDVGHKRAMDLASSSRRRRCRPSARTSSGTRFTSRSPADRTSTARRWSSSTRASSPSGHRAADRT
jgi:Lhr-like helicase